MDRILFVCSGNVFRSMCADCCLKNYIKKNNIDDIISSSAGTSAVPQPVDVNVKKTLNELGIDFSKHKQRKLSLDLIKENDLIVAMGENHKYFIEHYFDIKPALFLDICYGVKSGLKDNNEAIPNWQSHLDSFNRYNIETVKFIHRSVPRFVKNYKKFL